MTGSYEVTSYGYDCEDMQIIRMTITDNDYFIACITKAFVCNGKAVNIAGK